MFHSLSEHHQGVRKFLVKVTELKCGSFSCGDAAA
jgi:hypothetical protein